MTSTILVVSQSVKMSSEFESPFKTFRTKELFEKYCLENGIQIIKGQYGSMYSDDVYNYSVRFLEFIE